ncbi:hypothetical protein D3C86_1540180 [compost metagenome]
MLEIRAELEHAEDPQHADDPDNQQILRIGVIQREDAGHNGQQVHQSVKAEGVAQGFGRAVQAQDVFAEEDHREAPLDIGEYIGVVAVNAVDAVEHHDHQAGEDDQQQDAVEAPTRLGVGLENHDVKVFTPVFVAVHG